jgi:hypothetical protein
VAPLLAFFSLTFGLTWSFWGLAWGMAGGDVERLPWPIFYLGVFSPAFVALGMTARSGGGEQVRALLSRLFQGAVPPRWYLFAMGYLAAVKLTSAGLHRVFAGAWPGLALDQVPLLLAATIFSTLIGGQAGEEIGWRGWALPRLAGSMGLGLASVLLGVVWALWHLPLFYLPGTDTFGQSFPLYLVQVTGLSVAMGWLYGHTAGSLLLAMLMHSALNNTAGIVPGIPRAPVSPLTLGAPLLGWLTAGVIWAAAFYFLARMPRTGETTAPLVAPAPVAVPPAVA